MLLSLVALVVERLHYPPRDNMFSGFITKQEDLIDLNSVKVPQSDKRNTYLPD